MDSLASHTALLTPRRIALLAIFLCAALLFALGIEHLSAAPELQHAHSHDPLQAYEGPFFLCAALMILCYCRLLTEKMLWVFQEMHRWISALLVAGALSVDGLMHVFNIPHLEGWWVPLLGGSAAATMVTSWVQRYSKLRKKH